MKLFLASLALSASTIRADGSHCTYGHLYLSDTETANVYVMDVSKGVASNDDIPSSAAFTVPVPAAGAGEFRLKTSPDSQFVAVSHYGDRLNGNAGGFFAMVDTGFHLDGDMIHYDAPALVENMAVDECIGMAHVEFNAGTVTLHCDGYMPPIVDGADFTTQVNTTVHVIDLDKAGGTESAVLYTMGLEGAHHGVGYSLDKKHLLHSLPTDERRARLTNESLPFEFRVIDFAGNVLHAMDDTADKSYHCTGYHGSAKLDGTFALACNEEHAGILLVDYDSAQADDMAYGSRHVLYPTEFPNHRTGTIVGHSGADFLLANFANSADASFHIMAFDPKQTSIEQSAVFTLPASQCLFGFEKSKGEVVYVMTPENGTLHVLEWHTDHWDVLVQKQVIPGMLACSEVVAAVGVNQVFVAHKATKKLYVAKVEDGVVDVFMNDLPFEANRMAVAGAPNSASCGVKEEESDATSGADVAVMSTFMAVATASLAIMMW
ncbi:MAG: hypothetical protein SGBAC_003075 [Bacillariaceae sp.]